ncbi:cupin domain-containing protein [Magnetospira sp. QH-2]|uniref:cupin domain-containing protein n=1 Tax=Magnetospira sp. (strain QH-2) TaxID=1288970 RepID=UPI0003E8147D|nr:cupin domain-containing protein [Magnetospira sp. QH-2]CCQ74464.1 putative transcription negative regulator ChrR (modular protein) [Magnetospira sp. QH-2]
MDKPLVFPALLSNPRQWDDRDWEPFREGIEISWVHRPDSEEGPSSAFLRYGPGASVPAHQHPAFEYILVLEGSQTDDNGCHQAGSLVINPPGTGHAVRSEEGCLVLAIWEQPVRFTKTTS